MNFSVIPTSVLQPFFYAETSGAAANAVGVTQNPTVLMGQKLTSGTATANVLVECSSFAQAETLAGVGSQLAQLAYTYFGSDPGARVYLLPLADNGSTKAAKTITFVGTATAAGTISLYVGGQLATVPVAVGDTETTIAAAFKTDVFGTDEAAAVALGSRYPVTATNVAGALTITARNAGTLGNQIDSRFNYLGQSGGETFPAGITASGTGYLTGGSTDPSLTTAIANCAATRIGHLVHPYTGATELTALKTMFGDSSTGRWGPLIRYYGAHWTAKVDTYANLANPAVLVLKNDPHCSCFGIEASPTPPWEIAGNYAGVCAASLRADPSRPLNTLELAYAKAPAVADQFSWTEREVLLGVGVATPQIGADGIVRIQRAVSTYITNPAGAADAAFRDVTTPANCAYQLTEMESTISTKYGRVKIVDDGTNIGPGVAAATPSMIKATIIGLYRKWERLGLVENVDTFARLLTVERDGTDPTRVNVLYPPDLANGLMVFAVLNEFRSAYSEAELAA